VRGDATSVTHFLKEGKMIVRLAAMRFQLGIGWNSSAFSQNHDIPYGRSVAAFI
jgi:hypothetical protein